MKKTDDKTKVVKVRKTSTSKPTKIKSSISAGGWRTCGPPTTETYKP